jgi:hypothetical protein
MEKFKVYFQGFKPRYTEEIMTVNGDIYDLIYEQLEAIAKEKNMFLSESVIENELETFDDSQLRQELKKRGYYTDNLWHIQDIKDSSVDIMPNITFHSKEAQDILNRVMTSPYIMEAIWDSIYIELNERKSD